MTPAGRQHELRHAANRFAIRWAIEPACSDQLSGRYPFDFDDAVVEREFAVSKDGTRVPVTIIARKGVHRDGSNPILLYGYGGYGISMSSLFFANAAALA